MGSFEDYHADLAMRDLAPATKERYWQVLKSYRVFLQGSPPSLDQAKEFIAYLRTSGYGPASIALYYHVLKQFHSFLGQNLKLKLRKPKILPHYHDRRDIEALIAQADHGLYHHTAQMRERNKALVLVLAYTGMRRGELLKLMVKDVNFERRLITVRHGKGQKDRVIPMSERLISPLRNVCANKAKSRRLFEDVNARSVYRIVTGLARACGLDSLHPHSLRHWFGTQLVERGASLRDIQLLMGHASIETTAVYIDACPQHLRTTVDLLD